MNDDVRAARNKRRAYRRQAGLLLDEAELLLSQHLSVLLKEAPGTLTPNQRELMPVLVEMLNALQDRRLAALWSTKLATVAAANPRWLDNAPNAKSLHKVAGAAARVMKASAPDKREQAERKRLTEIQKEQDRRDGKTLPFPGSVAETAPKVYSSQAERLLDSLKSGEDAHA